MQILSYNVFLTEIHSYFFILQLKKFFTRFGSVQLIENFYRFRFGSVLEILPSVRFNFSKTRTDPITDSDKAKLYDKFLVFAENNGKILISADQFKLMLLEINDNFFFD